ncbi:MAG: tRNA (guanosine(46)-N7)-methyltransferase TrmB [Acidobacteria bacterium]|nr:tRNA (guanosine(46)-N7)-methyltransferase TrmB [Acidobacteriota bacterium]NIM62759.1 tRNA (guanosine(46)-N7)-methyltransferase TrmB [Acidobacteriota bacterium]NIO59059.1 tRNA (guanosine(46)-N7)-methyltransferase TrmB [Acidobacteriota bacterium]NIQ30098.1 tRNA (guanosine(46)-N7)-methyltransferase TrmB [Acidobacteriota bacterium]NIQ84901.1 tRNA (guanosine(46)-N7)-methyltransferase TrmB [Acidobacteriota bacterium]
MRHQPLKIEAPELRLDPERLTKPFSWADVFPVERPVEVEIGIGKGRFLLDAAEKRPEINHLGVEWANKYLRFAESRAQRRGLDNVRFVRVDAREIMPAMPDRSVDTFYVFYPDPWPKKRHHKRRFLREDMATELARVLVDGGKLHVATDHADYWEALQPVFDERPEFERQPSFGGPGFPLAEGEPLTHFEIKYAVEERDRHRASWIRRAR